MADLTGDSHINAKAPIPGENLIMLLTLAWRALGIATFWTATFVLNRRDRAARLAALQTRWATAVDRIRDMTR